MSRPYAHPKTRVYWLRKVVPAELRALVGKRELIESLKTKDPREARRLYPAVLARFDAILAAARHGERINGWLSQRDIHALCGEFYRSEVQRVGDSPGHEDDWDLELSLLCDRLEDTGDPFGHPDEWGKELRLTSADLDEAASLLRRHGFTADTESVNRLAPELFWTRRKIATLMLRRARGDWSPDTTADTLPTLRGPKVTFTSLLDGWAAESGCKGKALYDRQRTAVNLATFLGHDDAAKVTADDIVAWKEKQLAAGRSVKTVANNIGELRPIWTWARRNRKLTAADNPFAGLSPRTKRASRGPRGPFSDGEASAILSASRSEPSALLRWLPWLLAFTGCRIGEACQAVKEDVKRTKDDVWHIHIHLDGPDRTLKTSHSERMVPLHPALLSEGFLDYVANLPAKSSLFPDVRRDKFGSKGGTATKAHGRWVRKTVGITDTSKDPAHAWRHRFEDRARLAGLPQNVTDGLLGHLNPMNESEGYGRGYRFMPDATAPWVAKMSA